MLFVNTPAYCGGSEVSLLTLMRWMTQEGLDVYLVTSAPGPLATAAAELGAEVRVQNFPWLSRRRPWPYLGSIGGLATFARSIRADIIHTNCDRSLAYVMRASQLSGVPFVSHVRDMVRPWFEPKYTGNGLGHAKAVLVASQAMQAYCIDHGIRADKTKVIFDPIDLSIYENADKTLRATLRDAWQIPQSALVVGVVGHLQALKGLREFVAAALCLLKQNGDLHFLIVGSAVDAEGTKLEAELRQQLIHADRQANFHFVGQQTNMPGVYQALDILAMPSWTEGLGRAAIEAMASGRPVVATGVGGLLEIIHNGSDGLLVTPKCVDELTAALLCLMENAELRTKLVAGARRSVQRFAAAQRSADVLQLYRAVLAQ